SKPSNQPIVLSTIHQAKGLEWDTVFVIGLVNGQFPSYQSFKNKKNLEEERRLFYVAVTRAKNKLFLSYPFSPGRGMSVISPSSFLEDLDPHLEKTTT
ncbi:MAG: 3'-5' exonuclease, partial [Patescibacteria group bacterium]